MSDALDGYDGNEAPGSLLPISDGERAPMIRALPFGGCGLNTPINLLHRQHRTMGMYREIGFKRTPYALSSSGAVQLLDFLTGQRNIPLWLRRLCYGDPEHEPDERQAKLAFTADLALVEMSTPIDLQFDGVVLNVNRFKEVVLPALKASLAPPKLVSRWYSALMNQRHEVHQQSTAELLPLLPDTSDEERQLLLLVRGVTSRRLSVDMMTEHLGSIRERLDMPFAIIHHNFQYLPDGRPVSWPAEFKGESLEVARRLNVPALDFLPFVVSNGVARVVAVDNRHWNIDFYPEIAEHLSAFMSGVVEGRKTAAFS